MLRARILGVPEARSCQNEPGPRGASGFFRAVAERGQRIRGGHQFVDGAPVWLVKVELPSESVRRTRTVYQPRQLQDTAAVAPIPTEKRPSYPERR